MTSRWKPVLATLVLLLVGTIGAVAPAHEAVAADAFDISFFYGPLGSYGEWVVVQPYGWAWAPTNVEYGWRPYTVGTWVWADPYGWTWVSDEPWGWATYHYGRWLYVEDYGWVWLPGTVWAPAWVAFRYGDPWVGWAPLPPGPGWRFDAGFDLGGLDLNLSIGTYAWTFAPLRYFADTDLRSRVYVSAYNPYLVQRTQLSTRYAPADGGVANVSIDPATVEKARGAPIRRMHVKESPTAPEKGGARIEGDSVTIFRPHIAAKAPESVTPPKPSAPPGLTTKSAVEDWVQKRRAAIQAHLDAQRRALEQQDVTPPGPPAGVPPAGVGQPRTGPGPGPAMGADDAAKRRQAALQALEEERKRMEQLLERQRRRHLQELEQTPPQPPPPPPPATGGDHGGMGHGKGMDD